MAICCLVSAAASCLGKNDVYGGDSFVLLAFVLVSAAVSSAVASCLLVVTFRLGGLGGLCGDLLSR